MSFSEEWLWQDQMFIINAIIKDNDDGASSSRMGNRNESKVCFFMEINNSNFHLETHQVRTYLTTLLNHSLLKCNLTRYKLNNYSLIICKLKSTILTIGLLHLECMA